MLFQSCLINQKQIAKKDECFSIDIALILGFPKARVLCTFLFIIFINDFTHPVDHSDCFPFFEFTVSSVGEIQNYIDNLFFWSTSRKLDIHLFFCTFLSIAKTTTIRNSVFTNAPQKGGFN